MQKQKPSKNTDQCQSSSSGSTRRDELNGILYPWVTLPSDVDWDSCPDEVWEKLLGQAEKISVISRFWFLKGIHRAITEMERKIDGRPLWQTRKELIEHLNSINAPH